MNGNQVLKGMAVASLSLIIWGCDKSDSGSVKLPTGDEIKAAADSAQQSASTLVIDAQQQLNQGVSNSQQMYEKLKAEAAQFNDEKLKSLMSTLQGKLETAKAEVAKLKGANESTIKSIQSDVNAALAEVKSLYDQALARIAELRSGAAGGTK